MPRFVVVGNANCRRVALFQEALARLDLPSATTISWADLLDGRRRLSDELRSGDIVRFESTGRDFEVQHKLLGRGAEEAQREGVRFLSTQELDAQSEERGRMFPSRQWFLGLRSLFSSLRDELSDRPHLRFMHDLSDCLTMSDKVVCDARLAEASVPVAPSLGLVEGFEALQAKMKSCGWSRVFGKPAHGSSASGVFALQTNGGRWRLQTTVEVVEREGEVRLYNSRRLQISESKRDIARLVDALARDRLVVQRWLPKATVGGRAFDCRFVVVRGQLRQNVMRLSSGPMTNLHLGNDRASTDELRERTGKEGWRALEITLQRALKAFPASLFAGADVAFSPSLEHHAVLELNAWGDLLPGVLWQGRDTYEEEVRAVV